jgi:hypothetical protein
MTTVAAVEVGNYLGRGREYLAKLFRDVRLHTQAPLRCVCLTDDPRDLPPSVEPLLPEPGLTGWWHKLALFRPGLFRAGERILYFDLDAVIVGDLTDFAAWRGEFAILRDFYHPEHMCSAVMAWQAGALDHIWTRWDRGGRPQFDRRGDQRWIETMQPEADWWQDLLPGQAVSYKVDCRPLGAIPDGARIVCFHGRPRPHEVPEYWQEKRDDRGLFVVRRR